MKKIFAGMLFATLMLAPLSSYAQTATASLSVEARYQAALRQLISLLTARLHELQAQLAAERAAEAADDRNADEEEGEDRDDEERDEAKDAIDEAEDDLDDAQEEVRDADDDDDKEDAEDLLEDAEDELEDADEAYDDRDYDEAIDHAEEAKDLIEEALDKIDTRDNDDRDEDKEEGSVTVSTVPLLTGGVIRKGDTKPVGYIQIKNTSDAAVEIEGFWVKQNGSANAEAIRYLSTVDDKGGNRKTSDEYPFDDKTAFVGSGATIEAGALKLFTIKAELGSGASVGSTYKLDVTEIETDAEVNGSMPLRGTTWTVVP